MIATILLLSLPANAQEPGDVGLAAGYPGAIGIIWHASERVAVRPDFTFSRTTSENDSGVTAGLETKGWSLGFGVSALFYTGGAGPLRTFVSPRVAYARLSTTSEVSASTSASESTSNTWQFAGTFGAQYSLGDRFSVFGEAGLAYAQGKSTFRVGGSSAGVDPGETTNRTFGTRTAVGIVVYFK
jgi:opacity protein-like surface antigen